MNTDKHRYQKVGNGRSRLRYFLFLSVFICVHLWIIVLSSCTSKPSDLRTLVPTETLVYLETDDLAAALQPIVDSKPFAEVAKSKPDFSALKGVQVAVAVTGFETTEEKLTDEHSVGKVQPRFVTIADTHAWNFQAVAFADQKLGEFVTDIYKSDTTEEQADKHGGKYFTWTAADGRKAFALVIDSQIYFGNDESAIEKCLAVRSGEADSLAKTNKLPPRVPGSLASGYISTDGVAQIASVIGLKLASEASDDPDAQSAIASIIPQLLRNSVTEIAWTATLGPQGYEDNWQITMPREIASVFNETFAIQEESSIAGYQKNEFLAQLPESTFTATHYDLKDPQLAWRGLVQTGVRNLDPISGKILAEFSSLLFEPYGIKDPEMFLGAFTDVRSPSRSIITAKLDEQSGDNVAILAYGDFQSRKKALSPDLKPPKQLIEGGINIWSTDDDDIQVIFDPQLIKIGSKDNLAQIGGVHFGELSDIRGDLLRRLANSKAAISTVSRDTTTTLALVDLLAHEGHGDTRSVSTYLTETRFTKTGMERRTVSDFGLIGSIIAQLAAD
ncbi:MAG: hypothetical protein WBO10_12005 [Pyrinomonadaceae bacterium]